MIIAAIVRVDPVTGAVTDVLAPGVGPGDLDAGLAFGPGGSFGTDLYAVSLSGARVDRVDPVSGSVETFAEVINPRELLFDGAGGLLIASLLRVPKNELP